MVVLEWVREEVLKTKRNSKRIARSGRKSRRGGKNKVPKELDAKRKREDTTQAQSCL